MSDSQPVDNSAVQDLPKANLSYRLVLILLMVGAGALFLGYGRTWSTTTLAETGLPSLVVELSGRDVQPAGSATAIVALAAIAGLVATRRIGRLLSGGALVIIGGVDVLLALRFAGGDRSAIVTAVSERAGQDIDPSRVAAATETTWWWAVTGVGGMCLVAAGVITLVTSARWPSLGSRYEGGAAKADAPATSAWDQLDQGMDPTVEL